MLTTEIFIKKAILVHGDKYDYNKVVYEKSRFKVCIICPIHGEFWIIAAKHLYGCGCFDCAGNKLSTKENFIKKANIKHNNKFDYSKSTYINNRKNICIICPIHGEYWQSPRAHLSGQDCPKCAENFMDTEYFIEKANIKHNYKFDYTKTIYVNCESKITIICPEHGEFKQYSNGHLNGQGCPKCSKRFMDTEYFIEKAIEKHGSKYDYTKVIYEKTNKNVIIICPIHGEFTQTPSNHLIGKGCPNCKESKLEQNIYEFLKINNIQFETQKRFGWLKHNNPLFLDFYLPDYNIAIECQGGQHFECVKWFGGEKGLLQTRERDKEKFELCKANNIKILYFINKKYLKYNENFLSDLIFDKEILLTEIQQKGEINSP